MMTLSLAITGDTGIALRREWTYRRWWQNCLDVRQVPAGARAAQCILRMCIKVCWVPMVSLVGAFHWLLVPVSLLSTMDVGRLRFASLVMERRIREHFMKASTLPASGSCR